MSAAPRPKTVSLLACMSLIFVTAVAKGDDASCIASHVEAQRLQKAGKARAARDALVECANPACPAVIVSECTSLLTEVQQSVATVVFEARDETGRDLGDVRVSVGGVTIAAALDGRAVEIDPGEHTFRFERADGAATEQTVIVREGDKNRRIAVVLTAKRSAGKPPPDEERDISPGFWIAGGVGVAGLGLFGGLGIAGLQKRGALDDKACLPNCPADEVDEVRGLFIGADVSLAIGIAGLALAPIFYFTSPTRPSSPAPQIGLRLGLDGAFLTLGGAL